MSELLPQFDQPAALGGGIVAESNAAFLAANPRYCGQGSVTLSGTIANGDVLSLTFTSTLFVGGSISVSVNLTGADTVATATQKLSLAIQSNAALQPYDFRVVVYSGALVIVWAGPLGSYVTMSFSKTGTGTEAATIVQVTGGSGPIIPKADIRILFNGALLTFPQRQPFLPTPQVLAGLIAVQCPIS